MICSRRTNASNSISRALGLFCDNAKHVMDEGYLCEESDDAHRCKFGDAMWLCRIGYEPGRDGG